MLSLLTSIDHTDAFYDDIDLVRLKAGELLDFVADCLCEILRYRQNADTLCNDAVNGQCNPVLVRDFCKSLFINTFTLC